VTGVVGHLDYPPRMALLDHLPSLENARAADLLPRDLVVAEAKKLAALVVIADLCRRETWRETRALSEADQAELPQVAPPFFPGTYRSWMVSRSPSGGAVLEHVTDRVQHYRDVLVPQQLTDSPYLFGIESAVEALVPHLPEPAFECKDLRRTGTTSAYRGALSADDQPTFHEFDFADTIERARNEVLQLYRARGKVVQGMVRAFAWPLLHVRFTSGEPSAQLVVLPDAAGVLHALTGAMLEEREEDRPAY
jgi:hypothetical protein